MRPTTIVYIAASLDGFIARTDGGIDWLPEPEAGEDYGWAEFISTIDAILMGRRTFEKVLTFGAWPYEGTPVTVLSRTLDAVPDALVGQAEVSPLELRDLLGELAGRGHQRVYVDGGRTIQGLLAEDLVDELTLTRVPVLIGSGLPLFGRLDEDLAWDHVETRTYASGLVKSRYLRRRPPAD